MKKLLLLFVAAVSLSGCDAFKHPYDLNWYENPCEWYENAPTPGWYCKKPPVTHYDHVPHGQ